jgi:diacylglycerol kinase
MLPPSINNRILSFSYAIKGLSVFFKTQIHARIHLISTILVTGAGLYFHITNTQWCLVILAMGMVLSAEAMNTAIEFLTDLVSPEYHPLAGKTKDVAAAAVLLASIAAAAIGLLIFIPYLTKS